MPCITLLYMPYQALYGIYELAWFYFPGSELDASLFDLVTEPFPGWSLQLQ